MRRLFAAIAVLACVVAPAGARADCAQLVGHRGVLFSNSYDPDVLFWDSRQRLMDYAAGNWDVDKALLPYALLAHAGTQAVVVACQTNVVHPKFRLAPMDAIGVRITSGPYKGRYGWVLGDDVRVGARHARRV